MATEDQIRELRDSINEPDDANGWTDERLSGIIDGTETLNSAAARVWNLKAGSYATLVDVSESGSSRKLSDLAKNAQLMADRYTAADGTTPTPATSSPVLARIRRGFT